MKSKLDYLLNDPRNRGWSVYSPTIHGWEEAVLLGHNDGWIAGIVSLSANSMLYYGPEGTLIQYQVEIDHMIINDNDGVHLAEGVVLKISAPPSGHRTSRVDALIRYVDQHNTRLKVQHGLTTSYVPKLQEVTL